jgi:hypothetical protein
MNLRLDILQEGESRVRRFADRVLGRIYRSFAKTVSKLKICHFSGEKSKGFEVLQFSVSATTTQLLSSGEFCKLRCDTIPVKSASANVSFCTSNSKMPNFEL